MMNTQQCLRWSIVQKGGGFLALEWMNGRNTHGYEVLSMTEFKALLSPLEVSYLNTLDHWSIRVLYRQFSPLARKVTSQSQITFLDPSLQEVV